MTVGMGDDSAHLGWPLTPLENGALSRADSPITDLQVSLRLAERLLAAEYPREAGAALLESVVSSYGFPCGAVLIGRHQLSVLAAHCLNQPLPRSGASRQVEEAHDAQMPRVIHRLDADSEPWLATWLPVAADVLVVPLHRQERRLGSLILQMPAAVYGERADALMARLAGAFHAASLGLYRLQQIEQLQRLAATDDLTKIANRRSFVASLERELARAVRNSESLTLVILDIDNFKRINDTYGHPAGDDALRNVAAALSVACREFDIPARYGGEEFAVILPGCGSDASLAAAERLRAAVAAAPAVNRITASAGVATFPTDAGDGDGLIAAADEALLRAKRNGRDQTLITLYRSTSAVAPPPRQPP
jgi:diguanylate cyclase (GGDEF)-like protein